MSAMDTGLLTGSIQSVDKAAMLLALTRTMDGPCCNALLGKACQRK